MGKLEEFKVRIAVGKNLCLSWYMSWWAVIYSGFLRVTAGTGGALGEWDEQILSSVVFVNAFLFVKVCWLSIFCVCVCARTVVYKVGSGAPPGVLEGVQTLSVIKHLNAKF